MDDKSREPKDDTIEGFLEDAEVLQERFKGRRSVYVRAFLRDPATLLAAITLILVVFAAVFGPALWPHDAYDQSLSNRLVPPGTDHSGDNGRYWLGTDGLGRDVVARLFLGARVSLSVGIAGVVVSGLFGSALGIVAGYFRGRTEDFLMRWTDLQMAFPTLILALFLIFVIGPGFVTLVFVMAIVAWPLYARVARSIAISIREEQYIEASHALGSPAWRILREHILPNARSPLLILSTLEFARMILYEATLSFLGFGIQPPDTSWGLMISEGRQDIERAPWLIIVPGLCILAAALSANLLANWVQTITDPLRRAGWVRRGLKKGGAV